MKRYPEHPYIKAFYSDNKKMITIGSPTRFDAYCLSYNIYELSPFIYNIFIENNLQLRLELPEILTPDSSPVERLQVITKAATALYVSFQTY